MNLSLDFLMSFIETFQHVAMLSNRTKLGKHTLELISLYTSRARTTRLQG